MSLEYNQHLIATAKEMRKNATPQEKRLWYDFLRRHPVRFQRQKVIGNFIADFYSHAAKLVIEVDGAQHETEKGRMHDHVRTGYFEQIGLRVIRFTNREIDDCFFDVCASIEKTLKKLERKS